MHLVRVILVVAAVLAALGLIVGFAVPGTGRWIDDAAMVLALATWIVPPLVLAVTPKQKSSLAAVGSVIGFVVQAACLSVAGISLALVSLIFGQGGNRALVALAVIAAFWVLSIALLLYAARRRRTPQV